MKFIGQEKEVVDIKKRSADIEPAQNQVRMDYEGDEVMVKPAQPQSKETAASNRIRLNFKLRRSLDREERNQQRRTKMGGRKRLFTLLEKG